MTHRGTLVRGDVGLAAIGPIGVEPAINQYGACAVVHSPAHLRRSPHDCRRTNTPPTLAAIDRCWQWRRRALRGGILLKGTPQQEGDGALQLRRAADRGQRTPVTTRTIALETAVGDLRAGAVIEVESPARQRAMLSTNLQSVTTDFTPTRSTMARRSRPSFSGTHSRQTAARHGRSYKPPRLRGLVADKYAIANDGGKTGGLAHGA